MKKLCICFYCILSLLYGTVFAADFSNLIILHTNDTHGFDQRSNGINGMASVAALKKDYEAQGYDVLLVDAGDAIQDNVLVNFSKGKSAIAFMNACGYDAMTLGNHEFDYGQDITLERVREANFPVVSANIMVDATGKSFVPKHTIIQKGDVKIGVFGLTTPETIVSTSPRNTYGLSFLNNTDLIHCAQQEINTLRAAKCDLVICLSHLGSNSGNYGHRADDILANVNNLDICIDGHDHQVKNKIINSTLLVETGCHTENIGLIRHTNSGWQGQIIPYGQYNKEDKAVKDLIDQTAKEVEKHLSHTIGTAQIDLNGKSFPGVRTMETNLGDLCADALLWQARQANVLKDSVDGAIVNGGDIRGSISAGPVTVGLCTSTIPYNNQLYIIRIKGAKLLEILESATCITPVPLGAFPQVAGIRYQINTRIPYAKGKAYPHSTYFAPAKPGSRVTIQEVNGKPFDLNTTYVLAVTGFLCAGGDAYGALAEPGAIEKQSIGYMDLDALVNYIQEGLHHTIGKEYASPQDRITII